MQVDFLEKKSCPKENGLFRVGRDNDVCENSLPRIYTDFTNFLSQSVRIREIRGCGFRLSR
jgi:hypothetical protein